jgi:hypothetical protein
MNWGVVGCIFPPSHSLDKLYAGIKKPMHFKCSRYWLYLLLYVYWSVHCAFEECSSEFWFSSEFTTQQSALKEASSHYLSV